MGLIPGSERYPGKGNESPLQYSCLGNPMDRGAWQATVHEVTRIGHELATKPKPISKTGKSGAVKIEVQLSFSFPSSKGLQKGG